MTTSIDKIVDTYTNAYVGRTFQLILIDDSTRNSYPFVVNPATDIFTATGHNYTNGTRLNVLIASGTLLPAGLAANTIYYARDVATDTFKVSLTDGGAAVNVTDAGTGTFLVTDLALDYRIRGNLAGFVRKELTNYQGQSIRPTVTISAAPVVSSTAVTVTGSGLINNTSGASDLVFTAITVIEGGSTEIGNTTGTLVDYKIQASPVVVSAGQSKTAPFTVTAPLVAV